MESVTSRSSSKPHEPAHPRTESKAMSPRSRGHRHRKAGGNLTPRKSFERESRSTPSRPAAKSRARKISDDSLLPSASGSRTSRTEKISPDRHRRRSGRMKSERIRTPTNTTSQKSSGDPRRRRRHRAAEDTAEDTPPTKSSSRNPRINHTSGRYTSAGLEPQTATNHTSSHHHRTSSDHHRSSRTHKKHSPNDTGARSSRKPHADRFDNERFDSASEPDSCRGGE